MNQGPYRASAPVPRPPLDVMGWAFVAVPSLAGLAELLAPWPVVRTLAQWLTIPATIVLIAIDAPRWKQSGQRYVLRAIVLWVVCFPQYVYRRASWGGPRRFGFVVLAMLFFVIAPFWRPSLLPEAVRIECKPAGESLRDGLTCTLVRTAGTQSVEACWDVFFTCANGPGGSAHACATVGPRATMRLPVGGASVNALRCA